jgi:hypothetical protein
MVKLKGVLLASTVSLLLEGPMVSSLMSHRFADSFSLRPARVGLVRSLKAQRFAELPSGSRGGIRSPISQLQRCRERREHSPQSTQSCPIKDLPGDIGYQPEVRLA